MPNLTAPPRVSVIIPVYNGIRHLNEQMDALLAQNYASPWEAIYVDNGSTDGSQEFIRRRIESESLPNVRLIDGSQKQGQVHARNAGAAAARADLLAFTDQDDLPTPRWLAELDKALATADATGGYTIPGTFGYPLTKVPTHASYPSHYAPKLCGFEWAFGNNIGIHRHILEAVGGWQDIGVPAGEDVDLWIRLQLARYHLTRAMDAQVYWRPRQRSRDIFKQGTIYGRAEVLIYLRYRKHGAQKRNARGVMRSIKQAIVALTGWFDTPRSYSGIHQIGILYGCLYESIRSRILYL